MSIRSLCCGIALALLAAVSALCQTSSAPAEQPAPATSQAAQAPVASPPKGSANRLPSDGIQVARTMEDIRERILLDRIDQLEKRLADLEARDATATAAAEAQTPAPAATSAAQ